MTTFTLAARAFACALLAAAPLHAARAQSASADAQAAVPATTYRSALDYRAEPQAEASADQGWRAANAAVAGYNPMMLTMKSMGGHHAGHAMDDAGAADAPAAPRQAPAPAAAGAHEHHHHGEQP